MTLRIAMLGALAGLVLGGAGALVTAGETLSAADLSAQGGPAGDDRARCADAPRLARDLERHRAEMDLLDRAIAAMNTEEVSIIGAPSAFPDDLAPTHQPSGARAAAEAALAGKPYVVEAVDCDEFPCLVLAVKTPAAGGEAQSSTTVGATVALEGAGLRVELRGLGWRPIHTESGERQTSFEWIAFTGAVPLTDERKRRMEYRIALLNELSDPNPAP
jgi:hypothetical protein